MCPSVFEQSKETSNFTKKPGKAFKCTKRAGRLQKSRFVSLGGLRMCVL